MKLADSEPEIRAALARLAESPHELRCFVIIESVVTKRFVQFCTPPPPSRFAGSPRIQTDRPLIYDGTGDGTPLGYERVLDFCDIDEAVDLALRTLSIYLPEDAEIRIVEESTQMTRPS
jgi:DNA-binding transcriptional ArsR family regulator